MRHGFGINLKRIDFVSVNGVKMDFEIKGKSCILNFMDKKHTVENGDRATINSKIDIVFRKKNRGARGRVTFFCDDTIKIFRSNHPKIRIDL